MPMPSPLAKPALIRLSIQVVSANPASPSGAGLASRLSIGDLRGEGIRAQRGRRPQRLAATPRRHPRVNGLPSDPRCVAVPAPNSAFEDRRWPSWWLYALGRHSTKVHLVVGLARLVLSAWGARRASTPGAVAPSAEKEHVMSKVYPVPPAFAADARVRADDYARLYAESVRDPERFWSRVAQRLDWM
ncbi:MAG: acetyl-coenzyme A synthetase N-terminal domain-containing protein, partial [Metallibacterium sp.]